MFELLLLCFILHLMVAFTVPNFTRARSNGSPSGCKSNLKNIATALEMYSTDYGGRFPTTLEPQLTPNYLRTIPSCPSAGSVTYAEGYYSSSDPDWYEIHCHGTNHLDIDIGTGYPLYNSATGLLERP